MSPRKLEHFVAVAEAGSLSRAADKLDLAQPALSREIRDLEESMGAPLFQRHARGVELTQAGRVLLERATTILGLLRGLPEEVRAGGGEPSGRVALGMPSSMGALLTGPLIVRYRREFPNVRLHVREAMSSQLQEALLRREVDVAVLAGPVSDPQLSVTAFVHEAMMLVGPSSSGLSASTPVTIDEVSRYPLILPAPPHSARFMVEAALSAHGVRPNVGIEADIAPLAYFVSQGLGYSVVPWCATCNPGMVSRDICSAPIAGLGISWLVARSGLVPETAAVSRLMSMMQEMARASLADGSWPFARMVGDAHTR